MYYRKGPAMEEPSISRRTLFSVGAGMLTTLAAVEGGFLLPFTSVPAFADDATDASSGDSSATIIVVRPREVGIVVTDQANGSKVPVESATVTLTSRYNGKVLSDVTLPDGSVLF